ncbi:uncharacterized protein LOC117340615 [Pecten maximus]|uniref:uncharacterized protein LOC117340615 n=1 Tax=Pecten maximus TaxID=6579 RepID=UPI001457F035|nr:uncharacterized protein LOC117340615 [Pecten maximus]
MANLMYFIVFFATTLLDQTLGFSVALNKNFAVWGESLDIILNIGTINTVVTLYRPDGTTAGTCLAPSSGVSGGCSPGLTQDIAGGTTTYSIASVSRATDQGEWASSHGSDTGSKNITVHTIPTVTESNSLSSLTLSSDSSTSNTQSLTITVTCAYPAVSLNLFYVVSVVYMEDICSPGFIRDRFFKLLQPTGGGNEVNAPSSTSTCTSTGNTGCSDTNATSYTCDITPQYEATLSAGTTYYIKAAVKLDGLSIGVDITINGTDITVQESSTVNPNTKTNSNNSGDNKTKIAIGVTGGCVGGIALIGGGVFFMKNRKKKKAGQESSAAGRE